MIDQLIIGDKASYDDFSASMASRKIGNPKKKSITATVQYSNVTYDFSKINGELYWEQRPLEYVFEIIASTPEKLEELKTDFSAWVMNVLNEEIHDPFIPEYHFVGTFEDISFDDEETLDKTTVTVKFKAYPYKIANLPTVIEGISKVGRFNPTNISIALGNRSSHRVLATVLIKQASGKVNRVTLDVDGKIEEISVGTQTNVYITEGVQTIGLSIEGEALPTVSYTISFREEVF